VLKINCIVEEKSCPLKGEKLLL